MHWKLFLKLEKKRTTNPQNPYSHERQKKKKENKQNNNNSNNKITCSKQCTHANCCVHTAQVGESAPM